MSHPSRPRSSQGPSRPGSPTPNSTGLSPQQSAPSPNQRLTVPRPQLVRNASDTAVSSVSIMTLSKMYNEQQQQHNHHNEEDQHQQKPQKQPSSLPISRALASLAPSSKKLHKRVLSSSSTKDYFASANDSLSDSEPGSSSSHVNLRSASPGPQLPTFQRLEPTSATNTPSIVSPQPQQRPVLPKDNLSSSKIYERRMKQSEDNIDKSIQDDIFTGADIADEQLEDTECIDELNKTKRAEFFNSDAESDDVDIHSDDDGPKSFSPDKSSSNEHSDTIKKSQSRSSQVNDASSSTSTQNDEKKFTIKNLFRRMTISEGRTNDDVASCTSDMKKRNYLTRIALGEEDEFDNLPNDNIFTKLINMGGGGLTPGASKPENQKQDDEEAQLHNGPNDIPLQTMDPETQAQEILDAHRHHYPTSVASSSDATLRDGSDSFLTPNPDFYMRENDSEMYDVNIDGGEGTYVAPPERVRGGVLSSLLRLYQNPLEASRSRLNFADGGEGLSPVNSALASPVNEEGNPFDKSTIGKRLKKLATGKKKVTIDEEEHHHMIPRVSSMTEISSITDHLTPDFMSKKKAGSSSNLPSFGKATKPHGGLNGLPGPHLIKGAGGLLKSKREATRAKITVHIADLLNRQSFILKMCKALMLYGAPTHRLEEYMRMTSRVLEIDGQFVYLPGVMIVSFGDASTRTSEVQVLRSGQGLDLYRLHRVHRIYKQVVHDLIGVDEASKSLDELLASKPTFSPWMCVLIYGVSSASVTPWAYGGGWINLPVSFGIGLIVGFLQFIVSPKSNLYSNVFEVAASIVVSFIARALGSISGANICFSSTVQGSIALILPGWLILSGSLELQSRNLVSGSVRMFYAVIYSLMLGYGITLGAALYGWIDGNATDSTTCTDSISDWWRFLFVPMFTVGLALINQARLFQLPVMLFISCSGHVVSFFASKHFYNSTEFTAAIACFVIGILGNLYSRIFKGIAVSAMLPAVFVQIPGGMAAHDALLSGIESANQIVDNSSSVDSTEQALSGLAVGFSLIQVCVGITVGLFASTIVVYPFGKRSTSVFTL